MRFYLRQLGVTLVFGFLSVAAAGAAEKYTAGTVTNGGSLSGKVSFKGAQPAPEKFEFSKFPQPKFCSMADSDGKPGSGEGHRLRQDVKVAKDGGLSDAVVYITNITQGKAMNVPATQINAENCRFLVQGGPSKAVGVILNSKDTGAVSVTNNDADTSSPETEKGVLHNPHGYSMAGKISTTLFNKPVPNKGQTITEKVKPIWFKKADSFMKVECDQHNFMNAWALPVDNPYYAIVKEDGTFSMDQVPPGTYEVKAFHPRLGFVASTVEVKAAADTKANFEFAGK